MCMHSFIRVCVWRSCSCMYIKCVSVCVSVLCLQPPSPTRLPPSACQSYGPLIGGPGLSHHGNCTKANKGVERSRGNTVTQRGYLAQWKISGESHTKSERGEKPESTSLVVFLLNNKTSEHNLHFAVLHKPPDFKLNPHLFLLPALLTYANDKVGDVIS